MSDFLTWLAQSGDRLTVTGILLIVLFVVVYGVQKKQRWWVPGFLLTECEEDKEKLETRLQEYIDRTQRKLDVLESIEDRRMTDRKRSS